MKTIFVSLFLFFAASTSLFAQDDHSPRIAGHERFLEDDSVTDVQRGLMLINELNCHSCHGNELSPWVSPPRQAPILSEVGHRVQADYLERFISNPHQTKPGTTMPNVLADLPEAQRKQVAESLAHLLASTGQTKHKPVSKKEIATGEQLYHTVGCVACHDPQNSDEQISTSVPHGNLSEKYTVSGLTGFLRDPLHSRPSGRMPQFDLEDEQIRAIAAYLLRDVQLPPTVNFASYEGRWEKLPDFDKLKALETGTMSEIDINAFGLEQHFGAVFSGYWELEKETTFKFRLGSDDGSRLTVGDKVVLELDGVRSFQIHEATATIPAGVHLVRLEYFENSGGQELECTIENENESRQSIASVMRLTAELPAGESRFVVDPAKASAGQEHFVSVGCANCHSLEKQNGQDPNAGLLTTVFPPQLPLAKTQPTVGCISGAASAPKYGLSKSQQTSITAALEHLAAINPQAQVPVQERIHQQLTTMNCYTCHSRETGKRGAKDLSIVGGVVDKTGESLEEFGRQKWFTSSEAEMGDEGRLPPGLKLVGAKLNREWFNHILTHSSKDRPYMKTYMPKFGMENMPGLIDDFVQADQLAEKITVTQTASEDEIKKQGRKLVGSEGLSCIKCHTFGEFASSGVPAISLTTMTRRLDKDWFQAYMHKPSDFRRGTRMPESWPGGKTFFPDMLDGDTDKQIDALWVFLSDGDEAVQPRGLIKAKLEVVPADTPIVYRNFIEGAGPRAIGVGYPELANLAFDADNCRLAMIWQENFIDGSRHWYGRGQGFEPPLGIKIHHLPESIGFFAGDPTQWPSTTDKETARKMGVKFKGYRFDENRRPTFLYAYKDTEISDQPIPRVTDGFGTFSRAFTLSAGKEIAFRALVAKEITSEDGEFQMDGLTLSFTGEGVPTIVKQGNQSALVLTLPASAEERSFAIQYNW